MNRLIHTKDLDYLSDYWQFFENCGYKFNYDALWKWSIIAKCIDELKLNPNLAFVDAGGGLSPLHYYFSTDNKVFNVDNYGFDKTWFSTKDITIEKDISNIKYIDQDWFRWLNSVEDNSLDVVYDGCSIIHFYRGIKKGNPLKDTINLLDKKLKVGGYFVAAMDAVHPLENEFNEFMHINNIIKSIDHPNFEFFDTYGLDPCWDLEEFFLDRRNTHIHRKCHNSIKNRPKSCDITCKSLSEYHVLMSKINNVSMIMSVICIQKVK